MQREADGILNPSMARKRAVPAFMRDDPAARRGRAGDDRVPNPGGEPHPTHREKQIRSKSSAQREGKRSGQVHGRRQEAQLETVAGNCVQDLLLCRQRRDGVRPDQCVLASLIGGFGDDGQSTFPWIGGGRKAARQTVNIESNRAPDREGSQYLCVKRID